MDEGETEREFTPVTMPTSRLLDIVKKLDNENLTVEVLNLDACLPQKSDECLPVLQTILYKLKPSVKTLSLRFNNLGSPAIITFLTTWLAKNDSLEMLYLMSSGIDEKNIGKLEESWKMNLKFHSKENFGYSLCRVVPPAEGEGEEPEED